MRKKSKYHRNKYMSIEKIWIRHIRQHKDTEKHFGTCPQRFIRFNVNSIHHRISYLILSKLIQKIVDSEILALIKVLMQCFCDGNAEKNPVKQ